MDSSREAAEVKTEREPGTELVYVGPPRAPRSLANEVLVPVLVILIGALTLGLGFAVVKQFSGTDGGYVSQPSLEAASAPPAAAPVAAGGAQEKSRKAKRSEKRKTKRPEKKSATPDAGATTKKRSPAAIQPASEPVASSPAPGSGGGGGSNGPSTPVQNDPPPQAPPQAQHGIGNGEASHGIGPTGG